MKILLSLFLTLFVLKANAQNYLISFAATGGSATVGSVKVENLTTATSLIVNGSDVLRLTSTTSVKPTGYIQSSEMKIYPNPMTDHSIMQISPPIEGEVTISVFDMTGKLVAKRQHHLENYLQEFLLSGLDKGLYLISVKGNSFQYSGKLLCDGNATGKIKIERISSIRIGEVKTEKQASKGTQATVDMAYATGNRIKFTGISGIYSTVITDIPSSSKTITFNFVACTDGDNNNYPIVKIGSQIWMAENLKTTSYNDVTSIPLVTDPTSWSNLSTPGYCWNSNNEAAYKNVYGALYNWFTVNTGKLCPTGWHMPSDAEWTVLTDLAGGETVAGGKLKEVGLGHWESPNTDAIDEFGFKSLPGGHQYNYGTFLVVGTSGFWWSSSAFSATNAWCRRMNCYYGGVVRLSDRDKKFGFSVRCLKD